MTIRAKEYEGRECVCGRDLSQIHCPNCGTTNVYALTSKVAKHPIELNGVMVNREFNMYRCRRCGSAFSEYDLLFHCEAPKFRFATIGERRNYDKALESLGNVAKTATTPEEKRAAIAKMLELTKPRKEEA